MTTPFQPAINWFEIPVTDLDRAQAFYEALLAERLQVSLRTVYRDAADLQHQGVPIEGEAGVGYRMRAGFDLPPLMFSTAEAQALVAAIRLASPRWRGWPCCARPPRRA